MRARRWLVLAGLLTAIPSVLAAQRTLVLESFEAELRVSLDGSLEVTETIRPRFTGSWQGIYRDLSLEHRTAEDWRERLEVELLSITDEAGEPLVFEDTREGGWLRRFRIWVPGAEDATRTLVIRYVVRNALQVLRRGERGRVPGRALLERHGQRLAGSHRARQGPGHPPGGGTPNPVGGVHGGLGGGGGGHPERCRG
jgi:hypothetical protein